MARINNTKAAAVIPHAQQATRKRNVISIKTFSQAEAVFTEALRVIGDRDQAMRWMGTPVRALDYATPVSLIGTQTGRDAVIAVLSRLEHGVL